MRTCCVKNGLAVGVILLFIGITLSPSITAVDDDTETGDELIDNSEIEPLDDYVEIISFLKGTCESTNIKGLVINKKIEIYVTSGIEFQISVIKKPSEGLDFFFRSDDVDYLKTSHFTGIIHEFGSDHYLVLGIARGNIEWS